MPSSLPDQLDMSSIWTMWCNWLQIFLLTSLGSLTNTFYFFHVCHHQLSFSQCTTQCLFIETEGVILVTIGWLTVWRWTVSCLFPLRTQFLNLCSFWLGISRLGGNTKSSTDTAASFSASLFGLFIIHPLSLKVNSTHNPKKVAP